MEIGLAVLAGGASRRMGSDKSRMLVEGEPMVLRLVRLAREAGFHPIRVVGLGANLADTLDPSDVIPDRVSGRGPLEGIGTALHSFEGRVVVLAVDHPAIEARALAWLLDRARTLPVETAGWAATRLGRREPLISIWNAHLRSTVDRCLESGVASVTRCIDRIGFMEEEIPVSLHDSLATANTPEAWRSALPGTGSTNLIAAEEIP